MRGAPFWTGRRKAVNQSAQPLRFSVRLPFILHTRSFAVGEFRRIGASFPSVIGFTIRPMILPKNIRGGILSPTAHSIAREQCASACGAVIVPHNRSLSGLSNAIRSFTSCTLVASKRFLMYSPHLWSGRSEPVLSEYKSTTPARRQPQLPDWRISWRSELPLLIFSG